eukprot:CAMPEP_0116004180 /NCGR_PEP_ID=MMETSP0321-20121206/459_1 /TAXON_ID=163516 /ORGANISM="Leptocylindrus danicus var. danicus, Strain B650" /LENGTH=267 /DNA_ID=CAMNT_0003472453 /DNA_START=326 /DNA_END=1126 /DNA_ORIENTATION=+
MFPEAIKTNVPSPHSNDVLCGRGGGSQHHAGNKEFRAVIALNKRRYVNASPQHKKLLVDSIVAAVRLQNPPGRFLYKDSETGLWNDIGDKRAIVKTSQALREGAPKIRQALVAETKLQETCTKKCARDPPKSGVVQVAVSSEKANGDGLAMPMPMDTKSSERPQKDMATMVDYDSYESQFNGLVSSNIDPFGAPEQFTLKPTSPYQSPKVGSKCFSSEPYQHLSYQFSKMKGNSDHDNCVRGTEDLVPVTTPPSSSFKFGETADLNF